MTREGAKQLLPIIQAYAEGGTIQVRINNDDTWTDLLDNKLEISKLFEYRIKPEPKYRPFKNKEECWNEMLKHQPFGWLADKDGDYLLLTTVCNESDFILRFRLHKFADGTPFGIKE